MKPLSNWLGLLIFFILCFGAAGVGGWITSSSVGTWYATINKPPWNPPNGVFAPVWLTLYSLMAISIWRVWKKVGWAHQTITLFFVQLLLNVAWSAMFFGMRQLGLACAEITVVWMVGLVTLILLWRVDRWAGILAVPYMVWVSFAVFLNFTIWQLNRP